MELIPFVEHGCFWIPAHTDTTHLVDIQARRLFIIIGLNILTTGDIQDL